MPQTFEPIFIASDGYFTFLKQVMPALAFDKMQHPYMIKKKKTEQIRYKKNALQHNEEHIC